ncbi:cytochrome P450 [Mycolicibacterium hodleri]|uniref:Steroid C26-monooxygenase n=1 Tax=Mycolicibacterium hodleri TaxID=49897 RepID=A0A502E8N4_9MYCO|nr:cytochrome P450 [Mycolicibacterium hodleri]TPG32820.1 cytochrome P450 [Mycolicibacterium hodleri]
MPVPDLPPNFDFTDPDIYAERLPEEELAELRRAAPVWWNAQRRGAEAFGDHGYWLVTRHADVREVSLRDDVFSSAANCIVPRYPDEESGRGQIEAGRFSMINMDAPQHSRLRKIISRGFTPRAVERLRAELREAARRIAEQAVAAGTGDFVHQVAAELPLHAIANLLGVPPEDRTKLFGWTNEMVGDEDPEFAQSEALASAGEVMLYGMQLAARKSDNPGDDIVTKLIEADVDGQKLSDDEFGLFMVTLTVAGNETTRNSITQGMMAFLDNPHQWELFKAERPPSAADEIIRWATPITCFQRTALTEVNLGGTLIEKGQRVVLSYRSANFDDEVFDDPFRFDILRNPNPHLSFGGTGAHYCVGANLARMTINLMFDALADAMPDLKALAPPERLRSGWLNGIKHWQVDYTGGCPA